MSQKSKHGTFWDFNYETGFERKMHFKIMRNKRLTILKNFTFICLK
jgi:hypothetical protein